MAKHLRRNTLITLSVLIILLMGMLTIRNWPQCSREQYLLSTLTVVQSDRKMIGFNTDKEWLKLGVVSPEEGVIRSAFINGTALHLQKENNVTVTMKGSLAPWTSITPSTFMLAPDATQKVEFEVHVPKGVSVGNYTGVVVFCLKD